MTLPISFTIGVPARYDGFRCLHMAEGGHTNPTGLPEVRPSANAPGIPFTEPMQRMSFDINSPNPNLTGDKWRTVWAEGTAFTNRNGFDNPADPRADFINRRDLTRNPPKVMNAIICGGMFLRAQVQGLELVCTPGVSGIDVNKPMPPIQTVLENNWYFWAVTAGDVIHHFPEGGEKPVIIPYFLIEPVTYPLEWFVSWKADTLPDPMKIYL